MRNHRRSLAAALCGLLVLATGKAQAQQTPAVPYRPPSVPLVVHNPLFSVWSAADKLTDVQTTHWTKKTQALNSIIRLDGKNYRLMGSEPAGVDPLPQTAVTVTPTRTIYTFAGAGCEVTLQFLTPALPTDLDVLSRPLTYLTWTVKPTDGQGHTAAVFFSASSALAVDTVGEQVEWSRPAVTGLVAMKVGTPDQPYVLLDGDDKRIDWGYAYIAGDADNAKGAIGSFDAVSSAFVANGTLPAADDANAPRAVNKETPTLALNIDFGTVPAGTPVERRAMIAYDDVYAIDFFGRRSRAYWRRKPGMDGEHLLAMAKADYDALLPRCVAFDKELMADTATVGGDAYSYMCSLAYRQCIGGCGLAADANGQPMLFTKENTSNGNMATVDVLFPMDPIWVFMSPTLAKASVAPVFVYASSEQWKLPYAPHDLGEYPRAFSRSRNNGTVDPSEAMPVEESGNMIILADAISQCDGNTKFVDPWWPTMTRWVNYLEKYGPDPEEQLCTDDFNGRLAHNSNLAVKAIVGLGAYADMAKMRGDKATADRYMNLARADARLWMKSADDGDHYRLAYNKPGTWSQIYNLAWDKALDLDVFPPEVAEKEVRHYKDVLQPYGLPLDSRNKVTKTDWTVWTASLADNKEDFETLIAPLQNYLQNTPDRVAFVDGYNTSKLEKHDLFHARPVIGGIYMKMVTDKPTWQKWRAMDHETTGTYAPLPPPPVVKPVVPTSEHEALLWKYTTEKPDGSDWTKPEFDAKGWKSGLAGFGRGEGLHPRTPWTTDDIWLRREFTMPNGKFDNLKISSFHDEDVDVYINGIKAGGAKGFVTDYALIDLTPKARESLKSGVNVMCVHCHQTTGGQFIDVGLVDVTERK